MPIDKFAGYSASPAFPATDIAEILPDDDTDLARVTIAINVATPGTVRVTTLEGTTADLMVEAGILFPLRVRRVWQNGTTATGIRGLF